MIKTFSLFLLKRVIKPALFFLVLAGSIFTTNQAAFAENKTAPAILVLGDSLSGAYGINVDEGWVALLQQKLIKEGHDYKVINASVSGDTTRTGLNRIDAALKNHKPEIVIIALGANDGLRGLAFSEIETSLSKIIERVKKAHAETLLVGVRLPPNYGTAYNQKFSEMYRRLAQRYEITLVPKILYQVAENRELMQADGMHPTAEAQSQVMQNIWSGLEVIIKK